MIIISVARHRRSRSSARFALSQRPACIRISEERGITGLTAAPVGDDEARIPHRPRRLHESFFQLLGSYGHVREVPHDAVITAAPVQERGCCVLCVSCWN